MAQGLPIFQLVLDRLVMDRNLVRGMPVQIDALRHAVAPDVALEAVHGRDRPLIVVEPR